MSLSLPQWGRAHSLAARVVLEGERWRLHTYVLADSRMRAAKLQAMSVPTGSSQFKHAPANWSSDDQRCPA